MTTPASIRHRLAAALSVVALVPAAGWATPVTGTGTVTQTRIVRYTDLDLATPAGQAALDARLRRAARAVCQPAGGAQPLAEAAVTARCYRTALTAARQSYAALRAPQRLSAR